MEPKGSMLHSQGLSNNPYPELNQLKVWAQSRQLKVQGSIPGPGFKKSIYFITVIKYYIISSFQQCRLYNWIEEDCKHRRKCFNIEKTVSYDLLFVILNLTVINDDSQRGQG